MVCSPRAFVNLQLIHALYLFHGPLVGFVNDQVCDIRLSTQLCTSDDLFHRLTVCSHICTDPVSGGSNYANVVIVRWIRRGTMKVCHRMYFTNSLAPSCGNTSCCGNSSPPRTTILLQNTLYQGAWRYRYTACTAWAPIPVFQTRPDQAIQT